MTLNRQLLQQLAQERAKESEALLNAGLWSGAYYLAGYAVEFGLKACIAKLTNQYDFPDKDFATKCYTHKIENLIKTAGLEDKRDLDTQSNADLNLNWQMVKDWNESSRYELKSESDARDMITAVTEPNNGVLSWIMGHW